MIKAPWLHWVADEAFPVLVPCWVRLDLSKDQPGFGAGGEEMWVQ